MEIFVIYTQFYDETNLKFALFSERAAKSYCERYNKRLRGEQASASYERVSVPRKAPMLAPRTRARRR